MATIPGARSLMVAVVGLALLLAVCQVPFLPPERESVVPERSESLGLTGPVEVAVQSPVWSQDGVIRTTGSATNLTGKALSSCILHLAFLDHNGARVGMATTSNLSGIEPGETWEFAASTTGAPITDKYLEVEIGRVVVVPKS